VSEDTGVGPAPAELVALRREHVHALARDGFESFVRRTWLGDHEYPPERPRSRGNGPSAHDETFYATPA
jgi:hypothetical protein